MRTTILIPFYNERQHIQEVLKPLETVGKDVGVILIDDGSTDGTADFVKSEYSQFQLVQSDENRGKAAALTMGLRHVQTDTIILIDADLQNFSVDPIKRAISEWNLNNQRMIVFRRAGNTWLEKKLRIDVLLSGERMMLADDLKLIFSTKSVKNYDVEMAINTFFVSRKHIIGLISSGYANCRRADKWGKWRALKSNADMILRFIFGYNWRLLRAVLNLRTHEIS